MLFPGIIRSAIDVTELELQRQHSIIFTLWPNGRINIKEWRNLAWRKDWACVEADFNVYCRMQWG